MAWLPSPNSLQVIRSQFWPSPLPRYDFQLKSNNFTTKIQYDGINFAKNGCFAPIFASINIKSHYLQDFVDDRNLVKIGRYCFSDLLFLSFQLRMSWCDLLPLPKASWPPPTAKWSYTYAINIIKTINFQLMHTSKEDSSGNDCFCGRLKLRKQTAILP